MSNLSFSRSAKISCSPKGSSVDYLPPPRWKGFPRGVGRLVPAFAAGQAKCHGELFAFAMSVLFFKRFLKRPLQIASIVPSSQALVETHDALSPCSAFIIYQVTNELRYHAIDFAPESDSEYFLQNIPPMFITVFRKAGNLDGNGAIAPADAQFSSNYAR